MTADTRDPSTRGNRAEPPPTAPTVGPSFAGRSRLSARAIGGLVLAGWATYGPGSGITASILDTPDYLANLAANQTMFTVGALLMLLNSAAVVGIGVLWFPVLKRHSERVAVSYLGTRLFEAVFCGLGVVSLLSLIGISQGYVSPDAADLLHFEALGALAIHVNDLSYQIGMAALGAGSLSFCGLLYRARIVPRLLAAWGLGGYAVFMAGMVLDIFSLDVGLLLSVPGGLFELVFAGWLIAKGFDHSGSARRPHGSLDVLERRDTVLANPGGPAELSGSDR